MVNYVGDRSTNYSHSWDKTKVNSRPEIDGYTNVNLCISEQKRFFKEKIGFNFVVRNLFEEKWEDPGVRGASGFYTTYHPQPGRFISGSLNVKF